jgi:DNA-binding MltR family transcriptional regulator
MAHPNTSTEFDIGTHFAGFTDAMRGGFPFLSSRLSDTAAVITATALIDQALMFGLTVGFYKGAVSKALMARVFEGNGPLATFSSKIDLAHIQGLTSASQHHDLQILRKIRNEFAHSTTPLQLASFASCDNLKLTCARKVERKSQRQAKFLRSSAALVGEMMINVLGVMAKQQLVSENESRFLEIFQEQLSSVFATPESPIADMLATARPRLD